MLYCENCHAPIPEESAKCPYCGAFNAPGGERQYMEQLYDLKEDVEEISEVPKQAYRREMGKIGRILFRTFLVFAGLAAFCGAVAYLFHKSIDYEASPEEMKAQAAWEREVFPKLDALYEAGDYEGVLDYVYAHDEEGHRLLSNWEHNDFLDRYIQYQACRESLARIAAGDSGEDEEISCIMDVLFLMQEREYDVYTEAEEAQIEAYHREVKEELQEALAISEEELTSLYRACCVEDDYGVYLHYDTAKKKVRQYVKDRKDWMRR